jgi:hypothetical protein
MGLKCPYYGGDVQVFLPMEPGMGVPVAKCKHCGKWIERPDTVYITSPTPIEPTATPPSDLAQSLIQISLKSINPQ